MASKPTSSKLADSLALQRERLYVSTDGSSTFENDESQAPLPVPSLQRTLNRYLDSVKPFVTENEFAKTEELGRRFENGVGRQLQEQLLKRANDHRNWLEDWWRDVAYLRNRSPLIPLSNMAGAFGLFEFAKNYKGPRSEYAAKGLCHYVNFWHLIRREKLKPQKFRDTPWSMDQFRRAFNTTRIPQEGMDELRTVFMTESEQMDIPTNIIVLSRGHIFSVEMCDAQKQPLTTAEVALSLEKIERFCQREPRGKGVSGLTCQDRDQWAQDRQHLKDISRANAEKLKLIEDALMVCVLDETSPETRTEIMRESIKGRCEDRWADKSLQLIFFKNLTVGSSSDHSPFDGMVPICVSHWAHLSTMIDDLNDQPMGPVRPTNLREPINIDFELDEELEVNIAQARTKYDQLADTIDVFVGEFNVYGKEFLKGSQIHPEAFFQIVIQTAFMRLHERPAPTYCTASTRAFYHGRTETCRSCSQETVDFSRALLAGSKPSELSILLRLAVEKFTLTMLECLNAEGCDRHLMGLAIQAWLELGGDALPELFQDASFEKSGGNGKFKLSTSLNGFTPLIGCVTPMVDDGYGCFYSFDQDNIIVACTAFRSEDHSAERFYRSIVDTLMEMKPLLAQAHRL
ncbi:peroxisomal carnitine O-octanoyltransferase [Galendromus occidentalis]|uniref:Peroxisomal carnitine O-octanoyltransferase n=1 Tax=Galendromus occidentalis TaxID=34638 RepID=A0AAJ6QTH5_9ACAR|nr:peroxisomal carnitine O-octanoyltransferase [Galendromus occidentalis]